MDKTLYEGLRREIDGLRRSLSETHTQIYMGGGGGGNYVTPDFQILNASGVLRRYAGEDMRV